MFTLKCVLRHPSIAWGWVKIRYYLWVKHDYDKFLKMFWRNLDLISDVSED